MTFPYIPLTHADGQSWNAAKANQLEQGVALAGVAGTASSPPASPVDGMLWRLPADATLGVYWLLQYDSTQATYDWVAYGPGSPLYSQSDVDGSFNSTSYVDPSTTPNASVTVPRAGDYEIEFFTTLAIATNDFEMRVAPKLGSASTADADCASVVAYNTSGRDFTTGRKIVRTLAASDVVKLQYRSTNAGTATLRNHGLFVRPIRII
jgi:hypothetical protein